MVNLWHVYEKAIPDFLSEMASCPETQRLKDVGMNCGCEYTNFPRFVSIAPYSRFEHSMGAALIVWHFTRDKAQAAATLFHDIATPCFAHVVDFLRGDHLTQESTEDGTEAIIQNSRPIQRLLKKHGLTTDMVKDYHMYPIADNAAPRLSADRLEYTLGNIVNFGFGNEKRAEKYYSELIVSENDEGVPEIMFRTAETARDFFLDGMKCAEIYVCDVDRFAMQALAEILSRAIKAGAICEDDLMGTEARIIEKLKADPAAKADWEAFCAYREILRAENPGTEPMWRKIPAKKRFIDPYVLGNGRVSQIFLDCMEIIAEFKSRSQDYWVMGK